MMAERFTIDPREDLLEVFQDYLRRFGAEGTIVARGVSVVEVVLPTGERTYRVLTVGDCKTWEARGLMAEAISDMNSRNDVFWFDLSAMLEDEDEDSE